MKPETHSFYVSAVRRAVEQVLGGLDQALDLERLARAAALSPFHFHRIFRGMVGETPLELHRRLRMERAAFQLSASDSPVTSVALDAGYDSHEAFTRAFRARYDASPSEFRIAGSAARSSCTRPSQIELASRSRIHFDPQRAPGSAPAFDPGDQIMNVEVKTMSELRVATVHHVGPYSRISEAFARLGELSGRAGLIQGRPTMLAIYHDDPETTPEAELSSHAAIVIPEAARLPEGLGEQRLRAGRYACTTHVGPYEQLGDAWARFMGQWLPHSGERLGDGETFELYVNNPMEVPKEQLRTELYIPLA